MWEYLTPRRAVVEAVGHIHADVELEGAAKMLAAAPAIAAHAGRGRQDDTADLHVEVATAVAEDAAVRVGQDTDQGADEDQLLAPAVFGAELGGNRVRLEDVEGADPQGEDVRRVAEGLQLAFLVATLREDFVAQQAVTGIEQ